MEPDFKRLLTEKEAAAFLRLKPATLKEKRHYGLPPKFIKAAGGKNSRVLYDIEDLKDYLGLGKQTVETKE